MSCTRFHQTFWTSDQFFVIILVKISIFSCKKCAYLEIQLWVLLKFWLSPGLMKKEKKIFGSDWGLNWGLLIESQVFIPRDQRGSIDMYDFITIYISELMKKEDKNINIKPKSSCFLKFWWNSSSILVY